MPIYYIHPPSLYTISLPVNSSTGFQSSLTTTLGLAFCLLAETLYSNFKFYDRRQVARLESAMGVGPCRYLETSAELHTYLERKRHTMALSREPRAIRGRRDVFYVDAK